MPFTCAFSCYPSPGTPGIDNCDVISARITCPEYDAFNTGETYVDGWITVACGTAATVTIAIGPGASGDVVNRTMTMTREPPEIPLHGPGA